MRGVAIVAAIAIGCFAAPSAIAKEVRYAGKTSQGLKVSLKTNAQGNPERFVIAFDPVCKRGHFDGKQVFVAPFRRASANGFSDRGRYPVPIRGAQGKGKVRVKVAGARKGKNGYRGTFSFSAKYFARGQQFNACKARGIRWSVLP